MTALKNIKFQENKTFVFEPNCEIPCRPKGVLQMSSMTDFYWNIYRNFLESFYMKRIRMTPSENFKVVALNICETLFPLRNRACEKYTFSFNAIFQGTREEPPCRKLLSFHISPPWFQTPHTRDVVIAPMEKKGVGKKGEDQANKGGV